MNKEEVLIFEDILEQRDKLLPSLKKEFDGIHVPIAFFDSDNANSEENKPFDIRLKNELIDRYDKIRLIICDSDLSGTASYRGLSEVIVSKVAGDLSLPICLYAVGESYKESLESLRRWTDLRIILDISDYAKFADRCRIIYEGFRDIEVRYKRKTTAIFKKKKYPPSEILAIILEKPALADKIALYGTGNKQMLAEILPHYSNQEITKDESKRMTRLLGYWLWNSLLKFPGILLNKTAAASYLNINETQFCKEEIENLFKGARYKGPFSEIEPFLWRDDLDELLFNADCKDGLELVTKNGLKNINSCNCSVDNTKTAGFYCMLTEKPVSKESSRSNISWFPAGADLARISNPKFDELEPWLGLY